MRNEACDFFEKIGISLEKETTPPTPPANLPSHQHRTSMSSDIERGQPTEAPHILYVMTALAKQLSVKTPALTRAQNSIFLTELAVRNHIDNEDLKEMFLKQKAALSRHVS